MGATYRNSERTKGGRRSLLSAIRSYFDGFLRLPDGRDEPAELQHRLRLATAALFLEVARADFDLSEKELHQVQYALQAKFDLSGEEVHDLLLLADEEADKATCLTIFTGLINEHYRLEEKQKILELLWSVAFADEGMHKYEDHLIRKLADLLYLSHSDFMRAKHQAQVATTTPHQPQT